MPLIFFTVPTRDGAGMESEKKVNEFLSSHRIVSVSKEFVANGDNSFWALCVDYLGPATSGPRSTRDTNRVDYKEKLSPDDFTIFSELRDVRKAVASREGVPIYTIFTNQQLHDMVVTKVNTKASLEAIDGVGKSRVDKYATEFLSCLTKHFENNDEASGESISEDS